MTDFLATVLRLLGIETVPLLTDHSDFNGQRYIFHIENIINWLMRVRGETGGTIQYSELHQHTINGPLLAF